MTITIPDDLAQELERVAAAERKSVEQVAIERLRSESEAITDPRALLRNIRSLPHPSVAAVDELDASIAAGRVPVTDQCLFDDWPGH